MGPRSRHAAGQAGISRSWKRLVAAIALGAFGFRRNDPAEKAILRRYR
jgi:hypothetical protein